MAQRNPMNDRYQGEGPSGKTRKSASSAKPKSQAAASVYIKKKPTTASEKRAAQKKRDAEKRRKDEERARRAKEKEKAARVAAGLEPIEEKKGPLAGIATALFGEGSKKTTEAAEASAAEGAAKTGTNAAAAKATSSAKQTQQAADNRASAFPETAQYKRLRKIYWTLLAIALVSILCAIAFQYTGLLNTLPQQVWVVLVLLAYGTVIPALILDFVKIRPLTKKHRAQFSGGKKTPKQVKHEEEAAAYARELEEAREAEKASRKNVRRGAKRKAAVLADKTSSQGKVSSQGKANVSDKVGGQAKASSQGKASASKKVDGQAKASSQGKASASKKVDGQAKASSQEKQRQQKK
ncbi:MAG: hypothetical protein FWG00_03800 [Coriobacteriia bacterium]|nr:hypothetical protein [Coriobacteriia bacterium]